MNWVSVFTAFLVAHMVGDYLFQTDWQARHKRGGLSGDRVAFRALVSHVTTYTLAFVPALIWIGDELEPGWALLAAALIFLPHLVLDDGRFVRAYLANVKRVRRASTSGSRRRSTSPSTCSRCSSSRSSSERMTRRGRVLPLLAAAILAAAVGLAVLATDALRGLEHSTVDTRYDLRGEQAPRDDVVVVGIDDAHARADRTSRSRSTGTATRG